MSKNDKKNKALVPEVMPTESTQEAWQRIKNISDSRNNQHNKKVIDFNRFEALAQRLIPLKDIASDLRVHKDTLNNRCRKDFNMTAKEVWQIYASDGKYQIQKKVFEQALQGCRTSQAMLMKKHMGFNALDKQSPQELEAIEQKEINFAPSIKGFEGKGPEAIQQFMGEFLDLDPNHPLKKKQNEQEDDG